MTLTAIMRWIPSQRTPQLLLSWSYLNNVVENVSEWVLHEDIDFDYSLCFVDVPDFANTSALHIPIPTSMRTCMQIEEDDGSVFIVPSSKKGQSPIISCRMHPRIATPVDSHEDLKPSQFFHYAPSTQRMMKKMGYDLRRTESLNFDKR